MQNDSTNLIFLFTWKMGVQKSTNITFAFKLSNVQLAETMKLLLKFRQEIYKLDQMFENISEAISDISQWILVLSITIFWGLSRRLMPMQTSRANLKIKHQDLHKLKRKITKRRISVISQIKHHKQHFLILLAQRNDLQKRYWYEQFLYAYRHCNL